MLMISIGMSAPIAWRMTAAQYSGVMSSELCPGPTPKL
jgi:hypothetical protein